MKIDWGGKLVFVENRASEEIRCAAEPVIPPLDHQDSSDAIDNSPTTVRAANIKAD
jgi:hypothetical protein